MNIYGRDYSCFSEKGRLEYNEDQTLCSVKGEGASNRVIVAVADGMGGAHAADYASEVIKDHLEKLGEDELSNDFRQTAEKVRICIAAANNAIIDESKKIKDVSKSNRMGTTVSGAVVIKNFCLFFNVGDSRTYLIKSNSIKQFTEDHVSKESRGLIRSVGNKREVKVDIFPLNDFHILEDGDVIFCCTDGLWGKVTDEEIRSEIFGGADIHESLINLYKLAYHKGSTDNISMAAYRFGNFTGPERRQSKPGETTQIEGKKGEQKKKAIFLEAMLSLFFIVILGGALFIIFPLYNVNKNNIPKIYNGQSNNDSSDTVSVIPKAAQNAQDSIKQEIGKSNTSIAKEKQNISIKPEIKRNSIPLTLTDLDINVQEDILGKTKRFIIEIAGVNEIAETVKIRLIINKSGNVKRVDFLSLYTEPTEKMPLIKAELEAQIRGIRFIGPTMNGYPVNGNVIVDLTMHTAQLEKKIIIKQ